MNEARQSVIKQGQELSKMFRYLKDAPLKEGAIKRVLAKGAEPLAQSMQNEYLRDDPTKFGGDVSILVIVKKRTKRLNTVYVGPDTTHGESWRLWHIFNFGTVQRFHDDGSRTGMMPASRSVERAINKSKGIVFETIKIELAKEIKKYAKKFGIEV